MKEKEEENRMEKNEFDITIFEDSENGIGILNRENKFIYINKAVSKLFGYTKEELLSGKIKLNDLFPDIYVKNPAESEHIPFTEYEMKRKDGKNISVAVNLSKIVNSELKLGIFQDLSIIRKAKKLGLQELLKFAKKNMSIVFYSFEKTGPELIAEIDTENYPEEIKEALKKAGLFYMTAIQNNKGLFGPLPIHEKEEKYLGLIYSFEKQIEEKEIVDHRFKGKKPCLVTIVFPRFIESLYSNRRIIREVIKREVIKRIIEKEPLKTTEKEEIRKTLRKIKEEFFKNIEREEEEPFERKLTMINQFITETATIQGREYIYKGILELARKICDFKRISILQRDHSVKGLKVVESSGYEENIIGKIIGIKEKSIVARAARTKQSQNVENVMDDEDYIMVDPSVLSELAVPVISPHNREVVGVINIESEVEKAFTQEDVILFETLAEKVAMMLTIEEIETEFFSLLKILYLLADKEVTVEKIIEKTKEFIETTFEVEEVEIKINEETEKEEEKKKNEDKKCVEKPIMFNEKQVGTIKLRKEKECTQTEEKICKIISDLISFGLMIVELRKKVEEKKEK